MSRGWADSVDAEDKYLYTKTTEDVKVKSPWYEGGGQMTVEQTTRTYFAPKVFGPLKPLTAGSRYEAA